MKEINFPVLVFVMIMFLYVLIILVLLEIVYFENHLRELVTFVNNLTGV